jgi:hypothetical protein
LKEGHIISKAKAAFSLSGIIGILWIIIGALFIWQMPLGITFGLGFSVVGVLIVIIGILHLIKVIGAAEETL